MSDFNHSFGLFALASLFLLIVSSTTVEASESSRRAPWVGTMLNGTKCDGGHGSIGPYDYLQRDQLRRELDTVEDYHFNEDVENLVKGLSTSPMGDIHYTLRAWPNHHRALKSAYQFRLQHRELWNVGNNTNENYPAECYLQRAINFSPNDPIPYILLGMLLHQMGQYEQALVAYRSATKLLPNDLVTLYNMGLTLVALNNLSEAQQIADRVYAANYPLPGLKRKLAEATQAQKQAAQASPEGGPQESESKPLPSTATSNAEANGNLAAP